LGVKIYILANIMVQEDEGRAFPWHVCI